MATLQQAAVSLIRIVIGYSVACLIASLGMLVTVLLLGLGDPVIDGRSALGDLANQAGYVPVFAIMTAILAAPVALLAVIASEVLKIDKPWYFVLFGALAGGPVLFRGNGIDLMRMAEDFVTLGPIGALAGASFWLVRHRKWPV